MQNPRPFTGCSAPSSTESVTVYLNTSFPQVGWNGDHHKDLKLCFISHISRSKYDVKGIQFLSKDLN